MGSEMCIRDSDHLLLTKCILKNLFKVLIHGNDAMLLRKRMMVSHNRLGDPLHLFLSLFDRVRIQSGDEVGFGSEISGNDSN